ncbi:hypothetical protein EVAR_43857_1 [Eumeta japonica]|uniref:Uncharacterized protein n=1 Tax=Eumeta variegata TaxID=151549 RepID=A0A4C1WYT9_EUMVA|nr:hypothetical protein EVAR_43857_1 [Eumeta japonica]
MFSVKHDKRVFKNGLFLFRRRTTRCLPLERGCPRATVIAHSLVASATKKARVDSCTESERRYQNERAGAELKLGGSSGKKTRRRFVVQHKHVEVDFAQRGADADRFR